MRSGDEQLRGKIAYADYCASKYGVIGFSGALRSELKPWGIKVQVLCPPGTDTPGYAAENLSKPRETKAISSAAKILTPEQVALALIVDDAFAWYAGQGYLE